jgi:hypothetical protein
MTMNPCDYICDYCVAPVKDDIHRIWFSQEFLSNRYLDAPYCTWQRDGRKIVQVIRDTGRVRIWLLTDEYDCDGNRLGIWPD